MKYLTTVELGAATKINKMSNKDWLKKLKNSKSQVYNQPVFLILNNREIIVKESTSSVSCGSAFISFLFTSCNILIIQQQEVSLIPLIEVMIATHFNDQDSFKNVFVLVAHGTMIQAMYFSCGETPVRKYNILQNSNYYSYKIILFYRLLL